jgi:hypothetical protein
VKIRYVLKFDFFLIKQQSSTHFKYRWNIANKKSIQLVLLNGTKTAAVKFLKNTDSELY